MADIKLEVYCSFLQQARYLICTFSLLLPVSFLSSFGPQLKGQFLQEASLTTPSLIGASVTCATVKLILQSPFFIAYG